MRILLSYVLLFPMLIFVSTASQASDAKPTNLQLNGIWAANQWACQTAERFVGFRHDKFALIDQLGMAKDIGTITSWKWAANGKSFEFRTDKGTSVFQFDVLGADHVVLSAVRKGPQNTDISTPKHKKLLNLKRCDPAGIKARFLRNRKAAS